jgi:hypothetical protein
LAKIRRCVRRHGELYRPREREESSRGDRALCIAAEQKIERKGRVKIVEFIQSGLMI